MSAENGSEITLDMANDPEGLMDTEHVLFHMFCRSVEKKGESLVSTLDRIDGMSQSEFLMELSNQMDTLLRRLGYNGQ